MPSQFDIGYTRIQSRGYGMLYQAPRVSGKWLQEQQIEKDMQQITTYNSESAYLAHYHDRILQC